MFPMELSFPCSEHLYAVAERSEQPLFDTAVCYILLFLHFPWRFMPLSLLFQHSGVSPGPTAKHHPQPEAKNYKAGRLTCSPKQS